MTDVTIISSDVRSSSSPESKWSSKLRRSLNSFVRCLFPHRNQTSCIFLGIRVWVFVKTLKWEVKGSEWETTETPAHSEVFTKSL